MESFCITGMGLCPNANRCLKWEEEGGLLASGGGSISRLLWRNWEGGSIACGYIAHMLA